MRCIDTRGDITCAHWRPGQPAHRLRLRRESSVCITTNLSAGLPLWVRSRHLQCGSRCPLYPRKQTCAAQQPMSASLIGRYGSSAFRLSTPAVSMSLTGSCFSSESAPGPFHHGIRERGGTIFWAALPLVDRQVQADIRTHLIHRPARDIIPPLGGARVFSYCIGSCTAFMPLRSPGSSGTGCHQSRRGA